MDRTLNPVKRSNKRRKARNWKAWKIISPDGNRCRFCPHNAADHMCSSGQPHYFRPATSEELQNPYEKLYRYDLAPSTGQTPTEGESVLVKRVIVAQETRVDHSLLRGLRQGNEHRPGPMFSKNPGKRGGRGARKPIAPEWRDR